MCCRYEGAYSQRHLGEFRTGRDNSILSMASRLNLTMKWKGEEVREEEKGDMMGKRGQLAMSRGPRESRE